jgi:hypothetical protein
VAANPAASDAKPAGDAGPGDAARQRSLDRAKQGNVDRGAAGQAEQGNVDQAKEDGK